MEKICWLDYLVTCLSAKSLYPLSPKEWEAVMFVPQHPDLGNLGSWEEILQRGSTRLFLWVAPLRWARPTPSSLAPCSLWSWEQQQASGTISLSLYPLGSSPSLLTPPWASQNWGRCDSTKGLHRSQRQGNGDLEHQSWSHGGWWEDFRNKYYILKKILLNLCSKFQE